MCSGDKVIVWLMGFVAAVLIAYWVTGVMSDRAAMENGYEQRVESGHVIWVKSAGR